MIQEVQRQRAERPDKFSSVFFGGKRSFFILHFIGCDLVVRSFGSIIFLLLALNMVSFLCDFLCWFQDFPEVSFGLLFGLEGFGLKRAVPLSLV